jgi:PST family polysaccharide transporter
VLALVPLVNALGIVPDGLLRRDLRFKAVAIAAMAGAVAYGTYGVAFALLGVGVWAIVAASLAEAVFRTGVLLMLRPHEIGWRCNRSVAREIIVFSGGMTLRRLGHQAAESVDNIVIGRMLGAEALGIYGRAYQIVSVAPATVGRAMGHVMMPVMAKVQDSPFWLARAYQRSTGVIALVGLPGAVALALLAPDIVAVALGGQWLAAVVPLQILAAGVFLRLMLQLAEALGTAAGSVYAVAGRAGLWALAVLAGALLGAPWGLPGVASGVLAAQIFAWLLTAQLCLRITGLGWHAFAAAHLPGLRLAFGIAVICGMIRFAGLPPWLSLPIAAALSGMFVVGCWQAGWLGADGQWLAQALRDRLPKRFARA